jgi:hypothetical protein
VGWLAGWSQASPASRRSPERGARPERGAGCGAAACPAPLARARSPLAMPGFDYKFLEKPKRRLLCPLCGKPMREPVQVSTCGHRFCDTCLQEFLRCDSGQQGTASCGEGGHCIGRGAQGQGTLGLCLHRGWLTSGAPAVTWRGGGYVRFRGRPPLRHTYLLKGPVSHLPTSRWEDLGASRQAERGKTPFLIHGRPFPLNLSRAVSSLNFESFGEGWDKTSPAYTFSPWSFHPSNLCWFFGCSENGRYCSPLHRFKESLRLAKGHPTGGLTGI